MSDSGTAQPTQITGDPVNNHSIAYNDGDVFIEAQNTDTVPHTVTIVTPGSVGGLAVADQVVAVPASSTREIGPLAPGVYNNGDGTVYVNVDSALLKLRVYHS